MRLTVFYLLMLQVYQFKAKDSEIKNYPLCLGNTSRKLYFKRANIMKKTRLNGHVYNFSVDYRAFDTNNIIDVPKYLMKKHVLK